MPSPWSPVHPALPCLEAPRLSLLTLSFGSCSFGLPAALILAIPWKESFSITQLTEKPSACQLCLLTRVAGMPQQHTPAPAQPGLPVPAFCTLKPHTRLPSPLGTFHPGTPKFQPAMAGVGSLGWHSGTATLVASALLGVTRSTRGRLSSSPCRPPHACNRSQPLPAMGNGVNPHAVGDPTAKGCDGWAGWVGLACTSRLHLSGKGGWAASLANWSCKSVWEQTLVCAGCSVVQRVCV